MWFVANWIPLSVWLGIGNEWVGVACICLSMSVISVYLWRVFVRTYTLLETEANKRLRSSHMNHHQNRSAWDTRIARCARGWHFRSSAGVRCACVMSTVRRPSCVVRRSCRSCRSCRESASARRMFTCVWYFYKYLIRHSAWFRVLCACVVFHSFMNTNRTTTSSSRHTSIFAHVRSDPFRCGYARFVRLIIIIT